MFVSLLYNEANISEARGTDYFRNIPSLRTGYYGGRPIFHDSAGYNIFIFHFITRHGRSDGSGLRQTSNWRGCFQPMINVKAVVMLSGFVQWSNSTFSSDRITSFEALLPWKLLFLDVHSLVGRYWSN